MLFGRGAAPPTDTVPNTPTACAERHIGSQEAERIDNNVSSDMEVNGCAGVLTQQAVS